MQRILKKPQQKKIKPTGELDLFGAQQDDGQDVQKNASFETLKSTPHKYQLIENEEDAKKLYDYLMTFDILSLDTETTSTTAIDAELVGLSFAGYLCAEIYW